MRVMYFVFSGMSQLSRLIAVKCSTLSYHSVIIVTYFYLYLLITLFAAQLSVLATYLPWVQGLAPNRGLCSGVDSTIWILRVRMMNGAAGLRRTELKPAMWLWSRLVQTLVVMSLTKYILVVWTKAWLEHSGTGSGHKKEITISQ